MICTIDGPSGVGKSTTARRVADALGFIYFDTGAMFRAIAWGVAQHHIDPHDEKAILDLINSNPVTVTQKSFFFGTTDVTPFLRTQTIGHLASVISTHPHVRAYLAEIQRTLGENANAVFDGRDMGTVIFPHAEVKIFLTASKEVRAKRRFLELKTTTHTFEEILQEITTRDARDTERAHAPLRPADDAIRIDTSSLTIDEVVEQIVKLVNKRESK